ncbi:hypothetical protein NDU88_007242 [Pleurodeles waltl]|uniref:Uncharacterized protein n=1 Tax=Pleurodeles waltl TaxID=8319 RepID=A0AAV7VT02_PLEWA|nr:hypothetical protein NDU88_007242 [Pleurodeles waltl]
MASCRRTDFRKARFFSTPSTLASFFRERGPGRHGLFDGMSLTIFPLLHLMPDEQSVPWDMVEIGPWL